MTTAERLRAEGRAQGRAEGRAEVAARILLELLVAKFGTLPAAVVDRVHSGNTDELEAWMLRVLTATTLNEVFGPA